MSEPVTLEFLSQQCGRVLAEFEATRQVIRETKEALLRCIENAERIQALAADHLAWLKAANAAE